jgi:hypothetical protein
MNVRKIVDREKLWIMRYVVFRLEIQVMWERYPFGRAVESDEGETPHHHKAANYTGRHKHRQPYVKWVWDPSFHCLRGRNLFVSYTHFVGTNCIYVRQLNQTEVIKHNPQSGILHQIPQDLSLNLGPEVGNQRLSKHAFYHERVNIPSNLLTVIYNLPYRSCSLFTNGAKTIYIMG